MTIEHIRRPLGKETLATHLGRPHGTTALVNSPMFRGSTVLFNSMSDLENSKDQKFNKGTLYYGRFGTPDVFAFEEVISALEGAYGTICVPSGLASCVLPLVAFLEPGDHVLVTDAIYEPTRASLENFIARQGVELQYYDPCIGSGIAGLIRGNTKVIYLESPGSQTFEVQDVPAIVSCARDRGVITVCDNTWATAMFLRPLAIGVDVVVQAATKYISGHSDVMLGLVSCQEQHYHMLREAANWLGYHAAPDNVFLAARGIRTLPARMERHYKTGLFLAEWLEKQPQIRRVIHPALPSHPNHALWKRDFEGASGLFSFVLDASRERAVKFVESLSLFGIGLSWGGFESLVLISDPSHARSVTPWEEEGILIRVHVGLESENDLIADLADALALI